MKKSLVSIIIFLTASIFTQSLGQIDSSFSTPYATIYNHLYYLQNDSYFPEKSALSFGSELEQDKAIDYAIKLKQILDGRGLFVYMSQVPNTTDYRDSLSKKSIYFLFPEEAPEIFVERQGDLWLYSRETVAAIKRLHKKTYPLGTDMLLNLLTRNYTNKFLGLFAWQYVGILILLLIAFIVFLLLRLIFKPILRKLSKISFHIDLKDKKLLNKTTRILSLLATFVFIKYVFPILQLPAKWMLFIQKSLDIIITVFITLLVLRIADYILKYFKGVTEKTESKMDDQLMPIVSQLVKLVIIIAAILQVLHLMSVNITALIAGISIGGLALALAAKDTVGNLIGSLMIFIDHPFQIGDYIVVGGFEGTVKEVGFRSTRIQTKDTSIISIPNGNIANEVLVNKGIRVFRLFETTLGVTYDTPPHLIELFVKGLKELILEHPKTTNSEYYVYLTGLGDFSIQILFRVYLDTRTYAGELEIKEDLLLAIIRMAESIGIRFAFPSSTMYVEQFPGQKDLIPDYNLSQEELEKKLEDFMNQFKAKH